MVSRIPRSREGWSAILGFQIVHIVNSKVLHLDRRSDLSLKSLTDFPIELAFVHAAKNIEIPVVIVPEGARRVRFALRHQFSRATSPILRDSRLPIVLPERQNGFPAQSREPRLATVQTEARKA
jgi:hypothetical protein